MPLTTIFLLMFSHDSCAGTYGKPFTRNASNYLKFDAFTMLTRNRKKHADTERKKYCKNAGLQLILLCRRNRLLCTGTENVAHAWCHSWVLHGKQILKKIISFLLRQCNKGSPDTVLIFFSSAKCLVNQTVIFHCCTYQEHVCCENDVRHLSHRLK